MKHAFLMGLFCANACDPVASPGSPGGSTTDPAAAEALCWGTSGAWVNGACDCVQDGQSWNHVFDPVEAKVVKTFPLGEKNALFAGGAGKLFVYKPKAKELEQYDLLTGERDETAKKSDAMAAVDHLVVGTAVDEPVLAMTAIGQGTQVAVIDPDEGAAELEGGAARHDGALDPHSAHDRAVGGALVDDQDAALVTDQVGVVAGDRGVGQEEIVVLACPDGERLPSGEGDLPRIRAFDNLGPKTPDRDPAGARGECLARSHGRQHSAGPSPGGRGPRGWKDLDRAQRGRL